LAKRKTIFYIWKSAYPWDVRVEKICMALLEANYDVYIVCKWEGEELEEEIVNGLNILRVGYKESSQKYSPFPFNPFWKKSIESLIQKHKPDLLINREIILAEISGKLAKKYNIPIVMDMAENYPAAMKNWKKYNDSFLKRFIFNTLEIAYKLESFCLKLMTGVLVVCTENKNRLIYNYKFNKDNIKIIYNTPSIKSFNFKRDEVDREFKTIAYHGYINNERNLEIFLDVAKDFSDLNFDIWGKITSESTIKEDFNIYSNINFYGEYDLNSLKEIIKDTDIGVLPYKIDEHINNTISNKLFDYMANGIPVITSKAIPMTTLIDEYHNGVYYDFSDRNGIRKCLSELNKYDWQQLGKNGRKAFLQEFNWENDKKKLIEFIGALI